MVGSPRLSGLDEPVELPVRTDDLRMPSLIAKLLIALMVALVALLLASTIVFAQTGTYNPDTPADPATEARLKVLSDELRCLVCQNQTIADSNADLAVDLRRIVRTQILAGKSDAEIKEYLVARYGDFVLYKPPMQGNTLFLWIGPFALLAIGFVVWWFVGRRKPPGGPGVPDGMAAAGSATISDEELRKAQSMLDSQDRR